METREFPKNTLVRPQLNLRVMVILSLQGAVIMVAVHYQGGSGSYHQASKTVAKQRQLKLSEFDCAKQGEIVKESIRLVHASRIFF
jgi:hypothetical protein